MRLPLLVGAVLLPTFSVMATAEDFNLQGVTIVTATRTEEPVEESIAAVTVISRADIERSQARSVQDLLSGAPGVGISNSGGLGKITSLHLRGTEAAHVLVMIDGVKIGSPTTGTASFQDLPVDLIDHIEIVRGPRASLYGSEAIGGVVQIFTRKGGAQRTTFSVGGGSYGTMKSSGTVSGGIGPDVWYVFGLSGLTTDGFNSCKGRPFPNGAGCYTYEADKDGYENLSGNARVGWRFAPWGEAEASILRTHSNSDFDGTFVNHSEAEQQVIATNWTLTPLDYWKATLKAAQSTDDSDNYLNDLFQTRFNTRRDILSWQNDIGKGSGPHLITGVDWLNDHVDSTTAYEETSRANTGVFAQFLTNYEAHDLQFALRHDENEQFGGHATGNIGWGYKFANGMRMTASYGTAFKAPTFNELYFPGFGNPNLRPEESKTAEVGLSGDVSRVHWAVNVFETHVNDLIGFDASFSPVNIDTARIRGVETTLSTQIVGWDLRGNLTLLDPENMTDGTNHGNVLARRARQAWAIHADHTFGQWKLGASVRGEGMRYDDLANTIELNSYAVVDLRAEYRINDDWSAQLKVENVFDTDYETAYLYNQPGRAAYVTLRYQH
jgi:vitamin B12 transporter